MGNLTRRGFIGAALCLSGAAALPGMTLPALAGQSETRQLSVNTRNALAAIKDQIGIWEKEGKAFGRDKLAPDAEREWNRLVRAYFKREGMTSISVNAANLCPSLKHVDQMVSMVQDMLARDISFPMRAELAEAALGLGLDSMKSWLGLGPADGRADHLFALTANTTEGNNFINNGLVSSGFFDPQKDNVVAWDVNHPTNLDAWYYRKATQGWAEGSVRTLKTKMFANTVTDEERRMGTIPSDPKNADEIIAALKRVVDKRTKVVTLSWQSNECGMLLPMARIVEELRAVNKDMHIHADSAQTFGVLDMRLDKTGVDSIAGSFHKWPCGPKMVGIIYMNPKTKAAERFTPSIWGYDEHIMTPVDNGYPAESGTIDPNAKRFSYLGQQNDATLVAAWIAALFQTGRLHPNVTPAKIEKRIHHLGSLTKQALFRHLPKIFPDFREDAAYRHISTPTANDALRSSVFLFKPPKGIRAGDVMKNVYERHGFAIANLTVLGHELVRVSPTFCNESGDIEGVVEAVVDVIKAMQKGMLANNTHNQAYV